MAAWRRSNVDIRSAVVALIPSGMGLFAPTAPASTPYAFSNRASGNAYQA